MVANRKIADIEQYEEIVHKEKTQERSIEKERINFYGNNVTVKRSSSRKSGNECAELRSNKIDLDKNKRYRNSGFRSLSYKHRNACLVI